MDITFVLPGPSKLPSGGFKVVFEYANSLILHGHTIRIVFARDPSKSRHRNIPDFIKKLRYYAMIQYYPRWFHLNEKVQKIPAYFGITDSTIPDGDVVIATAVETAAGVNGLSDIKGKKFYFIQGYEAWYEWTPQAVEATYHYKMQNIVITKWLEQKVKSTGASCVLVPNGINFKDFYIENPIEKRKLHTISMLYNSLEVKGSKYGIAALKILKEKYPDLKAFLFGVPSRPKELPDWIEYTQNASPDQIRKIYNHSAIYLYPAIEDGFGLTGAEAMACGTAYVASDYGGVHEYAKNGVNVLLSQPRDVDGLVNNVISLFEEDEKRILLAKQGHADIQKFSLNQAVEKFEKVIRR